MSAEEFQDSIRERPALIRMKDGREFFIVSTMGLKPSPSGETFRFFACRKDRTHGKRWHETIAVCVRHSDGMESSENEVCFRMPPS